MKIKTKRLILRPIKESDKEALIENINNLNVSKWLLVVPYPYTKKDADWWINHCNEKWKKKEKDSYDFAIELKSERLQIGGIGLSHYDRFQRTAEIGYWLGEKYWRKGYISEALEAVINFAFKKLKLRRINIFAFKGNEASNGVINKFRLKLEGIKRKAVRCKATGEIHDENLYSLLKEEWKK